MQDDVFDAMYGDSSDEDGDCDSGGEDAVFESMYGCVDEAEETFDSMYGERWTPKPDPVTIGVTKGDFLASLEGMSSWINVGASATVEKNVDFKTSPDPLYVSLGIKPTTFVRQRKTNRKYNSSKRTPKPPRDVRPNSVKKWLGGTWPELVEEMNAPCCKKFKCSVWVNPWSAVVGRTDSISQTYTNFTAWVCGQLRAMQLANHTIEYRHRGTNNSVPENVDEDLWDRRANHAPGQTVAEVSKQSNLSRLQSSNRRAGLNCCVVDPQVCRRV